MDQYWWSFDHIPRCFVDGKIIFYFNSYCEYYYFASELMGGDKGGRQKSNNFIIYLRGEK